jgi:hypothetical protein
MKIVMLAVGTHDDAQSLAPFRLGQGTAGHADLLYQSEYGKSPGQSLNSLLRAA